MIAGVELFLRRLRNRLSRTAWAVRRFNLPPHAAAGKDPGLVLIQIDGLSDREMRRAMRGGKLTFLKSLLAEQDYRKHTMFSGIPSTTPAVQGELLYGVRQSVPAFCYYDKTAGRIFSMFEGDDAREVEARLEREGEPLLRNGSAYADVFTGGAAEAHFCMTQLGWPEVFHSGSPGIVSVMVLLHLASLVRIVVLTAVEFVLAAVDCVRGTIQKQDFRKELKFVPSRAAICIVMRELIVLRASMDLLRGLPVVHLNFLGYDEQSHRRGPDSAFAHWTLRGIDRAVKRIYRAAQRSLRRDYDVWVYSDHGQCRTDPYPMRAGKSVHEAIARVFDETVAGAHDPRAGIQSQRARMLRVKRHRPETQPPDRWPIVTALGPLGCVYLEEELSREERETMARRLVEDAQIPIVFAADGPGRARVWTEEGVFTLPEQAAEVLGQDHDFRDDVARDLVSVSHHPHAGDFFICGFRRDGPSLSFPNENGAHAGLSAEETGAFAILPADAPLGGRRIRVLHVADLRTAARRFLRGRTPAARTAPRTPDTAPSTLRVLTYNVHNCAGMDGTVSPHRIARVIEREQPDVVALQEIDVGRTRTAGTHQAALIARYLEMDYRFHAAIQVAEEQYGDAVLSRFPLEVVRAGALPYRTGWLVDEPRGALWVRVRLGGNRRVNVFNTHFGIWRRERRLQAEALVGGEWLQDPRCRGPVILCGDFNSTPSSPVYAAIGRHLNDAQEWLLGHKPRGTFPGRFPLHRLDHIYVSGHFEVTDARVPRTHLARVASDHLPLVVELAVKPTASRRPA